MKKIIGLTGGIGAGKSLILEILSKVYGACVLQEDSMDKELTRPGKPAYYEVVKAFGSEILAAGGGETEPAIDRSALAAVVYGDESGEKLRLLESIVHPAVRAEVERIIAETEGLIVVESAIPEKAEFKAFCDEIWYVRADLEIRIQRLMESRGYTRKRCEEAVSRQMSDEEYAAIADRIIDNSGDTEGTVLQLVEIMKAFDRQR